MEPFDGISILSQPSDFSTISALIEGPEGTPYFGGRFKVKLKIPTNFPEVPPTGTFTTKIYHPNISSTGEICVNSLKKDWNPKIWNLGHLLQVNFIDFLHLRLLSAY